MLAQPGSILFKNESNRVANIYRVVEGDHQFVAEIPVNQSSQQGTSPGEEWLVKDKITGAVIGQVYGSNRAEVFTILTGRGLPEKSGSSGGGD